MPSVDCAGGGGGNVTAAGGGVAGLAFTGGLKAAAVYVAEHVLYEHKTSCVYHPVKTHAAAMAFAEADQQGGCSHEAVVLLQAGG